MRISRCLRRTLAARLDTGQRTLRRLPEQAGRFFDAGSVSAGTAGGPTRSAAMQNTIGKVPAEELRRRAADYRLLAGQCAYAEGIDLLLLMANVHEDEAAAAALTEAEEMLIVRPVNPAG